MMRKNWNWRDYSLFEHKKCSSLNTKTIRQNIWTLWEQWKNLKVLINWKLLYSYNTVKYRFLLKSFSEHSLHKYCNCYLFLKCRQFSAFFPIKNLSFKIRNNQTLHWTQVYNRFQLFEYLAKFSFACV